MDKTVRQRFKAIDGWDIYEQDNWGAIIPDFVAERRHKGYIERAIIEVEGTCSSKQEHIEQINR